MDGERTQDQAAELGSRMKSGLRRKDRVAAYDTRTGSVRLGRVSEVREDGMVVVTFSREPSDRLLVHPLALLPLYRPAQREKVWVGPCVTG